MEEKEVGKVIHWYDKAEVAVVRLSGSLKIGDRIKVRRGGEEFDESVSSMEINHESVSSAKKGEEVAIKLSQKAKEGAIVWLI